MEVKVDHEEGWAPKNWCFQIVVLEKTLESSLDSKEIKSVNPKRNQPWIFIERTDAWSWSSNIWATWCKELTHWKILWCWERSRAGQGDDRGWGGWMASSTQCTWVLNKFLEIVKDWEAWRASVPGFAKCWKGFWPPHAKSWLIGKDSDAGRDWGQEEKGTTEDEMAGWHYWLDGHEFE